VTNESNGLSSPLSRIERAAWPIRNMLGWRRRRDVSLALFNSLNSLVGDQRAFRIAKAITGVEAERWLTFGEATEALKNVGVRKGSRFLHRLSHKASLSSEHQLVVLINAKGAWDSPSTPPPNPVAEITVTHTDAIRFLIKPLAKNS